MTLLYFLIYTAAIYAGVLILPPLFRWAGTDEETLFSFSPVDHVLVLAGAMACAGFIEISGLPWCWTVPFAIYLIFAWAMDAKVQAVYDILHYPVITAEGVAMLAMILIQQPPLLPLLVPVAVYTGFLLLQMWQHCYGFADTLAFITCGLFLCNVALATGGLAVFEALAYLLAMANVFFLVCNIGNITLSPYWKLKTRTAFIPDIALATALLCVVMVR